MPNFNLNFPRLLSAFTSKLIADSHGQNTNFMQSPWSLIYFSMTLFLGLAPLGILGNVANAAEIKEFSSSFGGVENAPLGIVLGGDGNFWFTVTGGSMMTLPLFPVSLNEAC